MNHNYMTQFFPCFLVAFGLALLFISVFRKSNRRALKDTGVLAEGIILEQSSESRTIDDIKTSVNDQIIVRFVTAEGEWITGAMDQGFQFFYTGQYKDGEKVKVFYNKEDPYHFYVDSKQSEMFGRIIGAVIGLVIIIIGLYQLLAVDDSL